MCNHIYNTSGAHIYRWCPIGHTRHGYRTTRTMTVHAHLHARVYYILRGTLSPAASVPYHNLPIQLPCLQLLAPQNVTLPPCLTYDTPPLTSPKEQRPVSHASCPSPLAFDVDAALQLLIDNGTTFPSPFVHPQPAPHTGGSCQCPLWLGWNSFFPNTSL
jgi:hypothetical protein